MKYLFVFIVGFVMSSLLFKNLILESNYEPSTFKVREGVNVLFAGDSHAQYGLSDKLEERTQNISYRSEKFIWSYLKLKKILDQNKDLKKIYLSVSYHSFAKGNDVDLTGKSRSFFYKRRINIIKSSF